MLRSDPVRLRAHSLCLGQMLGSPTGHPTYSLPLSYTCSSSPSSRRETQLLPADTRAHLLLAPSCTGSSTQPTPTLPQTDFLPTVGSNPLGPQPPSGELRHPPRVTQYRPGLSLPSVGHRHGPAARISRERIWPPALQWFAVAQPTETRTEGERGISEKFQPHAPSHLRP
jgi:hypothetical protein